MHLTLSITEMCTVLSFTNPSSSPSLSASSWIATRMKMKNTSPNNHCFLRSRFSIPSPSYPPSTVPALWLSSNDNNEENDDEIIPPSLSDQNEYDKISINNNQQQDETSTSSSSSKSSSSQTNISFLIFKFFSYIIQFLGLYFTFGLLLNILGYGYSFNIQNGEGFKVDKIENMRNEIQFQREVEREIYKTNNINNNRNMKYDSQQDTIIQKEQGEMD